MLPRGIGMTRTAILAVALAFLAGPAFAQQVEPERCPRLVALDMRPILASFRVAQAAEKDLVRLTFVGHATFVIESPAGVVIATDYNDGVRPDVVPTIATMNRAHITHFSLNPDPGIRYVLEGWGADGEPAHHELIVDDVWLRNVTTNIRGGFGMSAVIQRDQNSIFVFEVAGLCIAHLGHLHHRLTPEHLKALGRIDVVLVPVDGSYTLGIEDMVAVLQDINAPLMIPMHFFDVSTLQRFVARLGDHYAIETSGVPTVTLSRGKLPRRQTVLVLPGF